MNKTLVLVVNAMLLICPAVIIAAGSGQNIIVNSSFEQAEGRNPTGWSTQRWGGTGEFKYASIGRTANRSVMISSTAGADIGWSQVVNVRPVYCNKILSKKSLRQFDPTSNWVCFFN